VKGFEVGKEPEALKGRDRGKEPERVKTLESAKECEGEKVLDGAKPSDRVKERVVSKIPDPLSGLEAGTLSDAEK
jgi:hypothetical protein